MWPCMLQKATDAWLCALRNWSNHSETWAAVPFCTKNCPNWHQTVLGGENWPTTCTQHVGTTWQAFPPNYFVAAFITTLRGCVRKLKAPQRSSCTGFTFFLRLSAQKWLEGGHMPAIAPQILSFDLQNWFFWMQHEKLTVEKYIQISSISFLSQVIWHIQWFDCFNYKQMFFLSKNLFSLNDLKRWLNCCYWM